MIVSNPDSVHCPYAVGDVLTTSSPTPPAERWPGTTWTQIKDRFLLAAGDSYNAGSTGGEAQHALTINEMPKHGHSIAYQDSAYNKDISRDTMTTVGWNNHWREVGSSILEAGGSQPHNNMPPYQVFYFWERIA